MSLIDLGTYAGAVIAVITLLSKFIKLITAIHDLIERIDWMQVELQSFCQDIQTLKDRVSWQDQRLWQMANCAVSG